MILTSNSCRVCKFSTQDQNNLICRRYPPQVSINLANGPGGRLGVQINAAFAPVNPEGWCGEWARKIEAASSAPIDLSQTA